MKKIVFTIIFVLAAVTALTCFAKDPPSGSAADVMTSSGGEQVVFDLDFSDKDVNIYQFGSLKFRIYCPYSTVQINVCNEAGEAVFATTVEEDQKRWWTEFEFAFDSSFLLEEKTIVDLATEDGKLGKIKIIIDKSKSKTESVYIDTINISLREKDNVAPQITFDGTTDISVTAEKTFFIKNIKAYDEFEKRNVILSTKWEDGVIVDEFGCPPVGGPYKYTVSAEDSFGNVAEVQFNVTIREKDTVPPEFGITIDEITVLAGSFVDTNALVTDNEDEVVAKAKWQKGALDKIGRINEGDFELTISATDLTGNKAEKTILVHSVSSDKLNGITVVRDEGTMVFADDLIPYFIIAGAVVVLAAIAVVVIVFLKKKTKKA